MIAQRVPSVGTFCSEKNNWSQGKPFSGKKAIILEHCSISSSLLHIHLTYRALYPFYEKAAFTLHRTSLTVNLQKSNVLCS